MPLWLSLGSLPSSDHCWILNFQYKKLKQYPNHLGTSHFLEIRNCSSMQSMLTITSRKEEFLREMEIKHLNFLFLFVPIMAVLFANYDLLEILSYHFPTSTDSSNHKFFFHTVFLPCILQASCGPCSSSKVLLSSFLPTTLYTLVFLAPNHALCCFSVSSYSF